MEREVKNSWLSDVHYEGEGPHWAVPPSKEEKKEKEEKEKEKEKKKKEKKKKEEEEEEKKTIICMRKIRRGYFQKLFLSKYPFHQPVIYVCLNMWQ